MKRSLCMLGTLALASSLACAVGACREEVPPPNVPGPTTAHPDDAGAAVVGSKPPTETAPTGRVVQRVPDSRIVAFRVAFAAGSADDPPGKEGLTQLTAALMAEGGTKAMTYAQLVDALYPLAASIDWSVDRDETVFEATVPAAALDRFYPLLRDVLLTPRLDEEGFARVRARQASDLTSGLRGSDDERLGKEALQALIYEGHPYGHPPEGTDRGLAAVALPDVAAQRNHVFCKDRLLLGIAGGFPAGFDQRVASDLAQLPACDAPRAALPPVAERHGTRVLVVDKPSADATAISIGFPTPVTRASDDYPALLFATDFLGLHRQSAGRLFQELREARGLNYGDYAYAEYFEQDGWSRYPRTNVARRQQLVSIWLRPVKRQNAIFALRAALRVYDTLAEKGIAQADLDRFRGFLTRYIGLEAQTETRRLGYAMDDVTYGASTPYFERLRKAWGALDEARLKAVVQQRLTTKDLQIAIVAKDGAALAAALEKGDTSAPTYDAPKPSEVKSEDREIEKLPLGLKPGDVKVVPVAEMFR